VLVLEGDVANASVQAHRVVVVAGLKLDVQHGGVLGRRELRPSPARDGRPALGSTGSHRLRASRLRLSVGLKVGTRSREQDLSAIFKVDTDSDAESRLYPRRLAEGPVVTEEGLAIRLLLGDPESDAVARRGAEEQVGDALAAASA
jgi:hypothetical protein